MTPVAALTVAGSDSGGGAGIQADLRTFAAFGVHGCSALAALTAQSTVEVRDVMVVPPGFLRAQVEAVTDDIAVAATKTGMLATAENVATVAALAAEGRLPALVVDPVMISSTGARLLDEDAQRTYVEDLLPLALVATPNRHEAAALLGRPSLDTPALAMTAAEAIVALGPKYAVVTGGDGYDSAGAVDFVAWEGGTTELSRPRVNTPNTHGTGCSFAAAVAAGLANGLEPLDAIEQAKAFVHDSLARAADWRLGSGHGPIDHLAWTSLEAP